MPLRLALVVRGTGTGHRLGALEEGGGGVPRPLLLHPWPPWPIARGTSCVTAEGAYGNATEGPCVLNLLLCGLVLRGVGVGTQHLHPTACGGGGGVMYWNGRTPQEEGGG